MTSSNGYTLDQLLQWSRDDRLIDHFLLAPDHVEIVANRRRHVMSHAEAARFLKDTFRRAAARSSRRANATSTALFAPPPPR